MARYDLRLSFLLPLLGQLVAPLFAQPAIRYAAVGDFGESTSTQAVAALITGWNPDFVITVGDNNYSGSSTVAAWDNEVGQYYGQFAHYPGGSTSAYAPGPDTNDFFPLLGNHDWDAGITGWYDYFELPGNERYYEFVRGPVHFFAIDSDSREPDGRTSTSTQGQWLQAQLAASTSTWKIVYFHHPPYTSGSNHPNTVEMQWPFGAWGATAVLTGHNHHYERILKGGFPYFVDGSGGRSLYSFNSTPEPGSVVRYNADYGAMLIEANDDSITFNFYSIAGGGGGTLIDSYTIHSSPQVTGDSTLVPAGATWKYLDDGSNQGTGWRGNAFNDASWSSGPAQLGYGDGDEATVVSYGPNANNKYVTTYFRHEFEVADTSIYSSLTLSVLRDDGAVVYLNGGEVYRTIMPTGTITYSTPASSAISGADENTFYDTTIDPGNLRNGTNVIAVEIHQANSTSSDISIDVKLVGAVSSNAPPDQPSMNSPLHLETGVSTSPTLSESVSDAEAEELTVTFYGRAVAVPDFTIVGLPDTQFYSSSLNGGTPGMFKTQTSWVVANMDALNIAYVAHFGDCVQNGDNVLAEWQHADTAMSRIEDPIATMLPEGIPFGMAVGNHDQTPLGNADGTTTFYNQFFGESRFSGRSYYGGHYGSNNDNHFDLFSAGGLDFVVIYLEYDTTPGADVLAWADNLLSVYSSRRGIVVSHYLIGTGNPGGFGTQGQAVYDALNDNLNLFLMLCGHESGEGQRTDTFNGNTVHTVLADYQSRTNGGDGWLRIMEFSPANNELRVKTYSPVLGQFETDANSQFTLSYDMGGSGFQLIGTNTNVPSGSVTSITWPGLTHQTEYEWYVTVSDGNSTITSPVWKFTTEDDPLPIQLGRFTAAVLNQYSVRLDWNTLTETNNYGFEVQKSASTPGDYQAISSGFVPGQGTTMVPQYYSCIDTSTDPGCWYYRLKQIDLDGTLHYTDGIRVDLLTNVDKGDELPTEFSLDQNFPNPFNPSTKIQFQIPEAQFVRLKVYNLLGQEVSTLVNEQLQGGRYRAEFDGSNLPSGTYFYRLRAGDLSEVKKMAIAK